MGKITSIVGLVLILAAGVLASLSTSYEDRLKVKEELCAKYTKNAKEALKKGDLKAAVKFAKLAIKTDPENKSGYKVLEEIYKSQCSSNAPAPANSAVKGSETKKAPAKPKEEEAEEEELGC